MFPYTLRHKHTLTTVPSMWPLFCSGAGMCGAGWHCHTGQLTPGTGVGVIGPDHKETSSLQPIWGQWTSLTSQSQSLQWASVLVQWTTIIKICFTVPPKKMGYLCYINHYLVTSHIWHSAHWGKPLPITHQNTWQTYFTAHPTLSFSQVSISTKTQTFFPENVLRKHVSYNAVLFFFNPKCSKVWGTCAKQKVISWLPDVVSGNTNGLILPEKYFLVWSWE